MSQDTEEQRAILRKYVKEQRAALTTEQLAAAARDMCLLLESTPEYHHAVHIAAYWPMKGEMDVRPVIEQTLRYNKHVYLPVITDGDAMMFAPYDGDTPMRDNRYGIAEPDVSDDRLVSPRDLDLVILPLVVFDSAGNRLGMGSGHYDRTFAFLNEEEDTVKPVLVGAAHEFQHTGAIPPHPWDVPTRMVVTEQRVWRQAHQLAEEEAVG
ncbi:MAG: 5-formyltetrahydrofolate cyclo-ligase [Halofilum sp. (in: g-proteobacteria)]|nr:5-formyltetrahydrofolate cyclo-ligase [Halofilum sp. (in: g-proteobacteria)]